MNNEMHNDKDHKSLRKSRAYEQIEQKLKVGRKKASISRLIFYVIALIILIILMIWLKRGRI
ncbi:MAG: hypothetical protein ACUVWN_15480 [bacterium]